MTATLFRIKTRMMMMSFLPLVSFIVLFSGVLFGQNTSVYTSTKTGACKTIRSTAEGTGSYEGECPGTGGYKVRLLEGDIRQTLNVITPAKKKFELNFWTFLAAFRRLARRSSGVLRLVFRSR